MLTYRCRKTRKPPAVDASIAPRIWGLAEPAPLRLADTGKPPVQPTEARLLYDDEFLYVAFHSVDNDVWGSFTHRDDPICREEAVEIFMDTSGRARSYIEIEVSPLNTVYDLYILNDPRCPPYRTLAEWNCAGLRTAVHVESEMTAKGKVFKFWNCEMAIPFNQMHDAPNLPPRPGDRWRINLYRIDRGHARDEYSAWSPTGALTFHRPDKFGELLFLAPGRR